MKTITFAFVAALFLAACTLQPTFDLSGDLQVGTMVEAELEKEAPDSYLLEIPANTYLYGIVDQISVDVVVSLHDSAENRLGRFDGPGEGPEVFYFEVEEAGTYQLEVAPFEEESGSYTIELVVAEPIAEDPGQRMDQLFTPFSGEDSPGGVIGVIQDGKVIFSRAYGMANLSHGIPFTSETPTNIGSVSKQFTAFAILLLEQEGKLSLDDDVRKHIPELPELEQVVTLRNLLNHTNGLREVYNLMPLTGWKGEDILRREEVIEILKRQKELQALPGEEYNYNNSAFILLAEIVERISEQDFPDWMKENVFDPLGMESTYVRADPNTLIPNASQGYTIDASGVKESGDLYAAYGAGGIYTTVEDFSRWFNNFNNPAVGGEELITRLITPDTLNNGDTMSYALGIGVGEFRGLQQYSHGGADLAHRAMLVYLPEIDAGVAALSNHANFPSGQIAYNALEAFFQDELEDPEEETDEDADAETDSINVVVPEQILESYVGEYRITGIGVILEYQLNDGVLIFSSEGQPDTEMIPQSNTLFAYEGVEATVEFTTDDEGKVTQAVHSQGGNEYTLEPVEPYEPTPDQLKVYEGKYLSEELETFYTLEVRDSTLTLLIRNTEPVELNPLKEGTFAGDVFFIGQLEFVDKGDGSVDSFTVSNGRTRDILFKRYE